MKAVEIVEEAVEIVGEVVEIVGEVWVPVYTLLDYIRVVILALVTLLALGIWAPVWAPIMLFRRLVAASGK